MKFTSKYIEDMITCAESKLAAASSVTWRREYYGLYSLNDALCHINQLILFIFLLKRWNNSPSATNASTEDDLSRMFDRIIRMPYPCVLVPETTAETTVNRPPVVNAGLDKTLNPLVTSTTLTGTVTDPDGDSFTLQWTKISGGNATINTPSNMVTSVTNMSPGTYVFQLTATDSKGATASDTVTIVIEAALDTIYYGRDDNPFPSSGIESYILAGSVLQADSSLDVVVPWYAGADHPQWHWVAIPNRVPASNKNHWFVDIINQGNMGLLTDLFGPPDTYSVEGTDYLTWRTNYQTQFSLPVSLQKR